MAGSRGLAIGLFAALITAGAAAQAQSADQALRCRKIYNEAVAHARGIQDPVVRRNQRNGAKGQFIECMRSARAGRRVFFVPRFGQNVENEFALEAERNRRILAPAQAKLLGATADAAVSALPSGGSRGGATPGQAAKGAVTKYAAGKVIGKAVDKTIDDKR